MIHLMKLIYWDFYIRWIIKIFIFFKIPYKSHPYFFWHNLNECTLLHYIIKLQKYWIKCKKLLINVKCNHMKKVCWTTFHSHWNKRKIKKRLIIKRDMSNWVGWFLLIDKICTSCYSGTRSHRRLIFRIMNSHRMYTLCTNLVLLSKKRVCDFTWNDPCIKSANWALNMLLFNGLVLMLIAKVVPNSTFRKCYFCINILNVWC